MRRILTAAGLIALWSLPGFLAAAATLVFFPKSPTIGGNVQRFVTLSVAPWLIWALLTPLISRFARRFPIDGDRIAATLLAHLSAAVVAAFCYMLTAATTSRLALTYWSRPPIATGGVIVRQAQVTVEPFGIFLRGFASSRFPIGLVAYATIAGFSLALDEYRRRRARELQAARLETDLARAMLQALQMRLQPHFLFNTLHAVSMLVEEDPRAASHMITRLGDLLRETLSLADTPEVPLRKELDLLRQYLAIEQMRFKSRLQTEIVADDNTLDVSVPSFILQPIVENALRHGVATNIAGGRVVIRAERRAAELRLTVSDDGGGFTAAVRDAGIGLATTRDRLALRYGAAAALTQSNLSPGAEVTITIPLAHG